MWVEQITLENIKCFNKQTIKLGGTENPYPWVTLLGENGAGKSTILQSLALLLAGPEGAPTLLHRPTGWLKNESEVGKISIRIHQGENDPNQFGGDLKQRRRFGYTFHITGSQRLELRNKVYTEPTIVENKDKILTWLRENALLPKGKGWFGAGYGAFRRLTRDNRILVPSLQRPSRETNFQSQFHENQPLESFESWFVYLDYRTSKNPEDQMAQRQRDWGVKAINQLLPEGNQFSHIDSEGHIWFDVGGDKVRSIVLSDGFRSVMALAGDLVWRLIEAFPESKNPMQEQGVVLIDELDIHLHPTWQRQIAGLLRSTFPNIQFIMATHSPLVVAGAGSDAITYRCYRKEQSVAVDQVKNIHAKSVDQILTSDAFGLVSEFSPETQDKIDRYYSLKKKKKLSEAEKSELQQVIPFVDEALGYKAETTPVADKISEYIKANFP